MEFECYQVITKKIFVQVTKSLTQNSNLLHNQTVNL